MTAIVDLEHSAILFINSFVLGLVVGVLTESRSRNLIGNIRVVTCKEQSLDSMMCLVGTDQSWDLSHVVTG